MVLNQKLDSFFGVVLFVDMVYTLWKFQACGPFIVDARADLALSVSYSNVL